MTLEGIVRSRGRAGPPDRPPRPCRTYSHRCWPPSPPPSLRSGSATAPCFYSASGAALRRSELVGLCFGGRRARPGRGLTVLVQRSKTDQHGRGQLVAIWANPADPLTCPLSALERWLAVRDAAADVSSCFSAEARGARPLFCGMSKAGLSGTALSDKAVAQLVKTAAETAGLDPEKYSGHSLRAGLATAAADQGAGLADLMRQTRHKSTEVALGCLRPADLWRNNVTERVFARPPNARERETLRTASRNVPGTHRRCPERAGRAV